MSASFPGLPTIIYRRDAEMVRQAHHERTTNGSLILSLSKDVLTAARFSAQSRN